VPNITLRFEILYERREAKSANFPAYFTKLAGKSTAETGPMGTPGPQHAVPNLIPGPNLDL
jgi:hypothetical protein